MRKVFADQPVARMLFKITRVSCLVYIGFSLYLAIFQRRVLYYPSRAPEEELVRIAAQNKLSPWRTPAGSLIGWKPARAIPEHANVVLLFHGNAGSAIHRTYLVDGFERPPAEPLFHVFLMEYPGYGARAGTPSENVFRQAATEALHQLRGSYPGTRIFLVGESLGSGVAAWLAGENPADITGIFLITAFNRLADVARHHYPILPVNLLLRDRFESAVALETYRGPVGILLAGNDDVIPPQFGQQLYESYHGPKRLWIQDNRTHNTVDYGVNESWWQEVKTFLLSHTLPPPSASL